MAATPEIDALIVEIRKYRKSNIPEPVIQDIDSTYIPAWESIILGPGAVPGAPLKSVQFNDGGTFGGSAFFLFEKANGRASLGNLAVLTADVVFYLKSNLTNNILSDGNDTINSFIGYSTFGTAIRSNGFPNFATVTITAGANVNTYNVISKGLNTRNRTEGRFEVISHSHFGNIGGTGDADQTSAAIVLNASDAWAGAMAAGTYGTIVAGSTYDPTGGTPSVQETVSIPRALSGDFTNFEAGFFEASFESAGTAQSIFGLVGLAQVTAGTITDHIVGVSAECTGFSSPTYIAGLQVQSGGGTPVTAYGIAVFAYGTGTANSYGIFIDDSNVNGGYNLFSAYDGVAGQGKNFLGSGCQLGAPDTNISRTAAGTVGIGTGAEGSTAGTLRAAKAGIGGALAGAEVLTATGAGSITGNWNVGGNETVTGFVNAASYKVGGIAGVSGSWTTVDGKTVTSTLGIITSIV